MTTVADNPALTAPASLKLDEDSSRADADSKHDALHNKETPADKHEVGWRRLVRNFTASWFSVTMGTGIVALLLHLIPFRAQWLYYLSIVVFAFNAVLFALAFATTVLRYILYPEIWMVMIRDPVNSLFLATIPIGFATLIEMWVFVCVPAWGPWATTFAWVLWMIDAVVSFATTAGLSFNLMSNDIDSLSRITAVQLLPISATVVASATGGIVADVLPNPEHALGTLITCLVMWGMSMPLALTLIIIYYQRLAVHKLPPREVIISSFLPLGPLGYGGFGILNNARIAVRVFAENNTLPLANGLAGPILYICGFAAALTLWGFAVIWLTFAVASVYRTRPLCFNMSAWSFTFPLGVFAASTILIGQELPSMTFKVLGTIFSCAVIILWIVVSVQTARGAWTGQLFHAPCLGNLPVHKKTDLENGQTTNHTNQDLAKG